MSELLRLFTQITLLRRGPQDVPASVLLLVLSMLAYLGVKALVCTLLPLQAWPGPLLAETLFTLLWYVVLLRLVGRPERTVQTATAVFGVQTLLAPLLVACEWLIPRVQQGSAWQLPVASAGLLLLVWLITANSHVVKAALEWSATASVVLVILQVFSVQLLLVTLFPPAGA